MRLHDLLRIIVFVLTLQNVSTFCVFSAPVTERNRIVSRESGSCGKNVSYVYDPDTFTLTINGSGNMNSFESVSEIPWYKFSSSISKIIVKEGVTSIGKNAFCATQNLANVILPSTIRSIGEKAFKSSSVPNMTIPKDVKSIPSWAFYQCSNLKSLILPEGLESIGGNAFDYCRSLTHVRIPSSVTSIATDSFIICTSLTEFEVDPENKQYKTLNGAIFTIDESRLIAYPAGRKGGFDIPKNVASLPDDAFHECKSLTSVTIPSTVKTIGDYCFSDCTSLTSVVIPASVVSIGGHAFYGCSNLRSITIPEGITSIEPFTFSGCKNLTSIRIPSSVDSIRERAFESSGLTEITLLNITTIHENAFLDCELEIVSYFGVIDPCSNSSNTAFGKREIGAICVPFEYNSSSFCGLLSFKKKGALEDIENQCFHATCADGGFTATKRDDAIEWERRSNECVEYFCDNGTGLKTKSICSSNICVGGECKNGEIREKAWKVNITIEENVQEFSIPSIIETICNLVGGNCDALEQFVAMEMDDEGQILNLIVYVDDEETAEMISDYIKTCQ